HVFANASDDFVEVVDVHAIARTENARKARAMREQVVESDLFALAAGEFGNDFVDAGGEGKLAQLDRAEHEDVGDGFRGGKEAEDAVLLDGRLLRWLDKTDGFVETDYAVAGDEDYGAIVAAAADVVFNNRLQVLESRRIQAGPFSCGCH